MNNPGHFLDALSRHFSHAARFIAFTLCSTSAFALDPDIAVSVNLVGEAFIIDAKVDLMVPLRTAWEVLTDFDHMSAILGNLTSSKIIRREGQMLTVRQEGVAKAALFSIPFESEREIRLEPMKRILARQLTGTSKSMTSDARITTTEHGTHVDYRAEIVPDSVLARMFGASYMRSEIEGQFRAMSTEMQRREKRTAPQLAQPALQLRPAD